MVKVRVHRGLAATIAGDTARRRRFLTVDDDGAVPFHLPRDADGKLLDWPSFGFDDLGKRIAKLVARPAEILKVPLNGTTGAIRQGPTLAPAIAMAAASDRSTLADRPFTT